MNYLTEAHKHNMVSTSSLDIYVGNKIRERRKQLKLSQEKLANLLGISYQQVQKYESGNTPLTIARLYQISHILNTSPNLLHDGAPTDNNIGEKVKSDIIVHDTSRVLQMLLIEDNAGDELLFRKAVSQLRDTIELTTINHSDKVMDYLSNCEVKYGNAKPDIILLDINMPKINGLDLLKHIKGNQSLSHIPVLMLTSSVSNTEMEKAYKLQANAFLQKPARFDELPDMISSIIQFWSKTAVLPLSA